MASKLLTHSSSSQACVSAGMWHTDSVGGWVGRCSLVHVVSVTDGDFQQERPSLVVLELSKPGSSSLQVIQQLGDRFQSLATLPVMMLFAHSPHGEVDVVQKPLLSVLDGMRKEAELSQGLPTEADVTTPRQVARVPESVLSSWYRG